MAENLDVIRVSAVFLSETVVNNYSKLYNI